MTIIPLSEWYPSMDRLWRREGRRLSVPLSVREGYTVHHTAGGSGVDPLTYARQVADMHFARWQRPGGYQFLIGDDATIFEMCGWEFVGAHAPGGNRRSIGVSFQGSFRSTLPNAGQLAAFSWLVANHEVPNRQWGHRDWSDTTCPGTRLYRAIPLDVKDDDMTPEQDKLLREVHRQLTDAPDFAAGTGTVRNKTYAAVSAIAGIGSTVRTIDRRTKKLVAAAGGGGLAAGAVVTEIGQRLVGG